MSGRMSGKEIEKRRMRMLRSVLNHPSKCLEGGIPNVHLGTYLK